MVLLIWKRNTAFEVFAVVLLIAAVTAQTCLREECETPVNCVAGVALSEDGCCEVCALPENALCDEEADRRRFGRCGDNLDCSRRKDVEENIEAVCTCQISKLVCGIDGRTYPTVCSLNEEAIRRGAPDEFSPALEMGYWGPCKEAPVIVSPPADSYGPQGANLTLDCEARGFPAPTITWKFVSDEGKTVSLPSDDQSVAIQMRGGPEPMMVTSWAQIMELDPSYSGVYHCIAANTEGQVNAKANVGVYKGEL